MTSILFTYSLLLLFLILVQLKISYGDEYDEEKYGVKYASNCEVCKILSAELEAKLEKTRKEGGLLETGYNLDKRLENRKEYKNSQLRLIESMEQACSDILHYNIHKERKDSTRFAKGQSQTFSTLHGLVAKGVKVDLGIPYELWDKPSAEITHLKSQCEEMLEKYEGDIEEWYNESQGHAQLIDYLCKDRVLKNQDSSCLDEKTTEGETESKSKGERNEL